MDNMNIIIGTYFVGAAMSCYMTWVTMWHFLDIDRLHKLVKSQARTIESLQNALDQTQ